jgi:predicted ABC-type ATPase
LVFLWLPSAEHAVARVHRRVAEGGHSIPDPVVRRRYIAGVRNLRDFYLPFVDTASVIDNSDGQGITIAELRGGGLVMVHDPVKWAVITGVGQ